MKQKYIISNTSSTIREAMQNIEKNGIGTVFVIDENKKLFGVVTDGDIRRALLGGYGLNECIKSITNTEFSYAKAHENREDIIKKFSDVITILPIVDDNMHLVDYLEFNGNTHLSLAVPQLDGNEYKYLMDSFLSTWISSAGKYVDRFERDFADYCGMKYGVATSNGTTALHLALVALGIGVGDEVIVPNLTFAATINSVLYTGATPVIVDIEEDGWCISTDCIKKAISKNTRAIIPVHLYGQPCDMGSILKIADENNLYVIEDCAEAHGAKWDGKRVGGFGIINCFSFYGNKVITTGEGGMCLTDDPSLNERLRIYRDHGMRKERRYYHEVIGYNYRMTNMQAAIGVAQVEHIDSILRWREEVEEEYRKVLKEDSRIELQRNDIEHRTKISWLVSVLIGENKRDYVINRLKENNIDVRAFFIPLSEMDIYRPYVQEKCIVSERVSRRGINLPTTYDMTKEKVERIYKIIREAL